MTIALTGLNVKVKGQGYGLSSKCSLWDLDPQSRTVFSLTSTLIISEKHIIIQLQTKAATVSHYRTAVEQTLRCKRYNVHNTH